MKCTKNDTLYSVDFVYIYREIDKPYNYDADSSSNIYAFKNIFISSGGETIEKTYLKRQVSADYTEMYLIKYG